MPIKTAIVPVAGLGTRLLPISAATPKELLPLGGLPALHYIANELGAAGIERVVLVNSESKRQIENYFAGNTTLESRLQANNKQEILDRMWSQSQFAHMKFETVIQHEQNGLGHAVLCAAEAVENEPFVVALGDCVMGQGGKSDILRRLISTFESESASATIGFEHVPREKVSRYGIAKPGSQPEQGVFSIEDLIEKPAIESAPSQYAIAARYVLSPQILEILRETERGTGNEIQLTDAIRQLIKKQGKGFGVLMDQPRFDVGNLHSYIHAFLQFAQFDPTLQPILASAIKDLGYTKESH